MHYENLEAGEGLPALALEWSCEITDPDHCEHPPIDQAERLAAYDRGEWGFVGVRAVLCAKLPLEGEGVAVCTFRSAGVHGLPNDALEGLHAAYAAERDALRKRLLILAHAILTDPQPADDLAASILRVGHGPAPTPERTR
jgi:hypothetical protein